MLYVTLLPQFQISVKFWKPVPAWLCTDLDHLAGTWSETDFAEFQKWTTDFEIVDDKMWK